MAAQQAGIDSNGLHEGILWAFDGILHLRSIRASLDACLDLKGNGSHVRKQHHTEAVDQLYKNCPQIFARFRHAVVYRAVERRII